MAVHLQAKAHVFFDRHMRVKRVGLEHHGHAAPRRVFAGHVPVADGICFGGFLKTCHHAQKRGLTATRWSHKDAELAVLDVQIHSVDDLHIAVAFDDFVQCHPDMTVPYLCVL